MSHGHHPVRCLYCGRTCTCSTPQSGAPGTPHAPTAQAADATTQTPQIERPTVFGWPVTADYDPYDGLDANDV